ncbi:MAG: hypothetical protein ACR2PR_03850 [Pseudohongiellaceae bacterium]
MSLDNKRINGRFFTAKNPFKHRAFRSWATEAKLPDSRVLEPFAGSGSLLQHLIDMGLLGEYRAYDIEPAAKGIVRRDTLKSFPGGFDVCITNPPWLARNSATFRGLPFPDTHHDDLYKVSLERCLDSCGYVAALVPESFIRAGLFQDRLRSFVSLTANLFVDTVHPVGLAMFAPQTQGKVVVYSGNHRIGTLEELERDKPQPTGRREIIFNDPDGNLGLIALDNTREASIRFCNVRELSDYAVKHHCRHITKLSVSGRISITRYNKFIDDFREKTADILMTCYRGLRRDGKYRRRLDWKLARAVIENA